MVTTRSLEQFLEDALIEGGTSQATARAAAAKVGDELAQLATKEDLLVASDQIENRMDERFQRVDERFQQLEQRIDDNHRHLQQRLDDHAHYVDQRIDDLAKMLSEQIAQIERASWRMNVLVITMWASTFGALMYAVFG